MSELHVIEAHALTHMRQGVCWARRGGVLSDDANLVQQTTRAQKLYTGLGISGNHCFIIVFGSTAHLVVDADLSDGNYLLICDNNMER